MFSQCISSCVKEDWERSRKKKVLYKCRSLPQMPAATHELSAGLLHDMPLHPASTVKCQL